MENGLMTTTRTRRSRGFTMVELLIAIIIIGILVTIIVPVLSNRAADARVAAAKADMEAIANAESQVAVDTGYVVRLHVLDDSGAIGDGFGSDDINDVIDTIRDEEFMGAPTSLPSQIFLDAKTGLPLPVAVYLRAKAGPEQFGWRGPYANFQRKIKPVAGGPALTWTAGTPLDPWGNPYFLFVAGAEISGNVATGGWLDERNMGTPRATFDYITGYSVDATQFDRFTVLSLGPNGLPGDGSGTAILGTGDDLVRAF